MPSDLTDDQKRALRWIADRMRGGDEKEIIVSWSRMGMHPFAEVPSPPIEKDTFDVLRQEGYLDIRAPQENTYVITPTEQAFDVVDAGLE